MRCRVFPPTRSYAIKPLVPTYWDQVRPYLDFPSWFRGGPTHAQPPPSTRDGKVGVHADLQTTEHYPLAFALVGADLKSGTAFSWCGDCVKGPHTQHAAPRHPSHPLHSALAHVSLENVHCVCRLPCCRQHV